MRPRMYGSRLRKWWRTSTWPSASGATGVSTSLKFSATGSPAGREARRIWRLMVDMVGSPWWMRADIGYAPAGDCQEAASSSAPRLSLRRNLKVPVAWAHSAPLASRTLPSQKAVPRVPCSRWPQATSRPVAGRMKLVFISRVTMPGTSVSSRTLRAACAITTSSSVITTPPCATAHELSISGRTSRLTSATPESKRHSCMPSVSTKGMSSANFSGVRCSVMSSGPVHGADAAVDGDQLAGDVLARVAGQQQRGALQVLVVAEAAQRRVGAHVVDADMRQQAGRHLAGEEARRQRVDVDAVHAPLAGQRAREVQHRGLAGVVGDGRHAAGVARQARDRGDVDDAAAPARDHAGLADRLRQQEDGAD